MALKLYVDVHVPASLTRTLRSRSIDVLTSQDDGTREVDDETLLLRAASLDRLLMTQDEDFLEIASRWLQSGREFPGLFFARQGQPVGRMATDLELCLTCCAADGHCDQVAARSDLRDRISGFAELQLCLARIHCSIRD